MSAQGKPTPVRSKRKGQNENIFSVVAAVCDRRKTALTERRYNQSKLALILFAPSIGTIAGRK
jgi:hypothetical protein